MSRPTAVSRGLPLLPRPGLLALEDHVARGALGGVDEKDGEPAYAGHEPLALPVALVGVPLSGHIGEELFPLAGGDGGGDLFGHDGDELPPLFGGDDALALPAGVAHLDEAFDDGGAGGGRAEAGGLHLLPQGLVLDVPPGVFHQVQKRGVGVGEGRLGLAGLDGGLLHCPGVARVERRQRRLLVLGFFVAVERPPALHDGHGPGGFEIVPAHTGHDPSGLILIAGIVRRHEPPHDHIVEPALVAAQPGQVGGLVGGHDGMVVGHLGVVVEAAQVHSHVHLRRVDEIGVGLGQPPQRLFDLRLHVVGQIAAVGAGIGDQLVGLIERLGQLEGLVRGEAQAAVGLSLEAGQVVELGRRRALALADALGHGPGLPGHGLAHGLGLFGGSAAGLLRGGVHPQPGVVPEIGANLPVVLGHEPLDLLIPLYDQVQRGGLHPPDGQVGVVFQRKRAAGVHAHQPVGLRTAPRRGVQRVVIAGGPQPLEALLDGGVGHG